MDPTNEPLQPTIEQEAERKADPATPGADAREEEGLTQPESSAQKAPPPGPRP
jgi:hypothetical protein